MYSRSINGSPHERSERRENPAAAIIPGFRFAHPGYKRHQFRNTSGLMQLGGVLPASRARMLSTTMFAICSRTSPTALPRCGVVTTLAISTSARAMARSLARDSADLVKQLLTDHHSGDQGDEDEREVVVRVADGGMLDGDLDLSSVACGDIDIVGRVRLRRDKTQFRVSCDHVP